MQAALEKLSRQNTSVGQRSSPGLNMNHGFMKKIQQIQMEQRRQLALKNAAGPSKELQAVSPQRSTKPTMPIYRPPGARIAEMERQQQFSPPSTDDVDRWPTNDATAACDPVPDPKTGPNHCEVQGFSPTPRECSSELDSIVQEALHDPNALSEKKIQGLACLICQAASRSFENAERAVTFCKEISLKMVESRFFIESLLSSCNELFGSRSELMGPLDAEHMPMRWAPYVTFVAKLLQAFETSGAEAADAIVTGGNEMPHKSERDAVCRLACLLSSCFQIILRPPSLGSIAEMECLRLGMAAAGKAIQRMHPHLMYKLMTRVRDAFLEDGTTVRMRGILLEVIELHGSEWQLTPAQQMYYYPSRPVQRRE